jgi:hypothetical protein
MHGATIKILSIRSDFKNFTLLWQRGFIVIPIKLVEMLKIGVIFRIIALPLSKQHRSRISCSIKS